MFRCVFRIGLFTTKSHWNLPSLRKRNKGIICLFVETMEGDDLNEPTRVSGRTNKAQ